MTKELFFDTDCISAFLWVNQQNIVAKLYPNRIVIPKQVYEELSYPNVSHLKRRVDSLIDSGEANVIDIEVGSKSFDFYMELISDTNEKSIGKGEASTLALARFEDGIVASNNLRDILKYTKRYNLKHITTGEILVRALDKKLITEEEGNTIWRDMMKKKRKLGANSFSEFLVKYRRG